MLRCWMLRCWALLELRRWLCILAIRPPLASAQATLRPSAWTVRVLARSRHHRRAMKTRSPRNYLLIALGSLACSRQRVMLVSVAEKPRAAALLDAVRLATEILEVVRLAAAPPVYASSAPRRDPTKWHLEWTRTYHSDHWYWPMSCRERVLPFEALRT